MIWRLRATSSWKRILEDEESPQPVEPVVNDVLIAKVQPSSSKSIRLVKEKTSQQHLAVEARPKECEELKNTAQKWEQETVKLRTYIETNKIEICEAEE